jgi:metacaspase-1
MKPRQLLWMMALTLMAIPFVSLAGKDPVKHALIIAVGDYPAEGRWPDISSGNDVALIRGALLQQGFSNENIRVVMDNQASKQLLVKEFENMASLVQPGDIVVIHYSGHGQQIQDDNQDELDGWDESIIPWDAQIRMNDKYHGENHLRDDEIKTLTDQLRIKLGPEGNLLLILDACHSGTANRGLALSRGTFEKFSEPGYNPEQNNDNGNYGDISAAEPEKMATMVTISGASQHELNYEYFDQEKDTSYGSLSYAFSRAIAKAGKETTYRSLFDLIKVDMSIIAPRQSPQIEGDVDQKLFGGNIVETEPYFMVTGWFGEQNVTINAGNLMGIYDSSLVAFYPIGTVKITGVEPIAKGTVTNAMAIESDVSLDRKVNETSIKNSWVYVTKQNYGDNRLNIRIDISSNTDIKKELSTRLVSMPKVKIVDQNPDLILEANNKFTRGNNLHLITKDEEELYFANIGATLTNSQIVDGVIDEINRYIQVNLLKKIDMKDDEIDVTFEIVPVTVKKVGNRYVVDQRLDVSSKRNAGNELEFKDQDCFVIKVKNNGYKRAYFQILDIRANNDVELLYPDPKSTKPASEFTLDMQSEVELGTIYQFREPFGNEYLKLIATEKPIDLRFIVSTRGADSRGGEEMSPFEELLQDSYKGTRAGTLSVPPSSATVYTIPFKVVGNK